MTNFVKFTALIYSCNNPKETNDWCHLYAVNWSSLVSGSKSEELLISATTWANADPRAESIELKTPPILAERGLLPSTPPPRRSRNSTVFEDSFNPLLLASTPPLLWQRVPRKIRRSKVFKDPITSLGQISEAKSFWSDVERAAETLHHLLYHRNCFRYFWENLELKTILAPTRENHSPAGIGVQQNEGWRSIT